MLDDYQWIRRMQVFCDQETERLKEIAQTEIDSFWVQHHEIRHTRPYSEWGRLGVRIAESQYGFRVEWYLSSFHGPRGNKVVRTRTLRKSKLRQCYTFTDCRRKAKSWELLLALDMENTFIEVRRKLKSLARIRLVLRHYSPDMEQAVVRGSGASPQIPRSHRPGVPAG